VSDFITTVLVSLLPLPRIPSPANAV